jgi:hypothetical protein
MNGGDPFGLSGAFKALAAVAVVGLVIVFGLGVLVGHFWR